MRLSGYMLPHVTPQEIRIQRSVGGNCAPKHFASCFWAGEDWSLHPVIFALWGQGKVQGCMSCAAHSSLHSGFLACFCNELGTCAAV